jgi:hypothetical protein
MAKKNLRCIACASQLQKYDAQFVDEETFAFLKRLPAGVALGVYCNPCFDAQVKNELDRYTEKMARAKNVNIFYLTQSKESRFVRRIEKPIEVTGCHDREETILRLAFLAIEAGNNALVDVALNAGKITHDGGYKTSRWSGKAIPADIEESALKRRFMSSPN